MPQFGEGIAVAIINVKNEDKQECVFCEKKHQDEEAAKKHTFERNMSTLKSEGRRVTRTSSRIMRYPDADKPPLVDWKSDPKLKLGGYKAAAHHCIALETVSKHPMSGELHAAGYDPNGGNNCIWLPYNREQFIRSRAYGRFRALQKHRGGHTNSYFQQVENHLERVAESVEKKCCKRNEKVSRKRLLRYMSFAENKLWEIIARATDSPYHLYSESFLDPNVPWGAYEEEQGINKNDYLGVDLSDGLLADDDAAESENEEDPERE